MAKLHNSRFANLQLGVQNAVSSSEISALLRGLQATTKPQGPTALSLSLPLSSLSSRLLLFSGNLVVFLRPPRVPFFLLGHANDAGHFKTGAISKLHPTATSLPNPVQPNTHGGRALADLLLLQSLAYPLTRNTEDCHGTHPPSSMKFRGGISIFLGQKQLKFWTPTFVH